MSIANSCRTQWVQKLIQEKQAQYTGIIDLFQAQNVSKLYIQCNFFTDLGFNPSVSVRVLYAIFDVAIHNIFFIMQ
jgi:hypothetical protein